jgi:heme oxygenase (biliverdin-IX-beta and delta-forming)
MLPLDSRTERPKVCRTKSSVAIRGRHLHGNCMTEGIPKTVPGAVRAKEARRRSVAPAIKTVIGTVHRALRDSTRNEHALLDRLLLRLDLSKPSDYRAFLTIHAAALLSLRTDWRAKDSEDIEQMLRCLQTDLGTLGTPMRETAIPARAPLNLCTGFGTAYVIRGSRLGAAFLRRGVAGTLSTLYLDFVPALSWAQFLAELESVAEVANGTDEAVRAARSTFNVFAAEFTGVDGMIATSSA